MSSPLFSEWCSVTILYFLRSSHSVIYLISVAGMNLCQWVRDSFGNFLSAASFVEVIINNDDLVRQELPLVAPPLRD
jgi:hypothetical protein